MAYHALTLKMVRLTSLRAVMHAGYRGYGMDELDMAIQMALGRVMDALKPSTLTATKALTADAAGLNLDGAIGFDTFHPHRLVPHRPIEVARSHDTYPREPIELSNYEAVADLLRGDTQAGLPTVCGFRTERLLEFHPIPDAAYPIDVTYFEGLVQWTPGLPQPYLGAEITLNFPARFVRPGLWYGVVSALVFGEVDTLRGQDGTSLFQKYLDDLTGGLGVPGETILKDPAAYQ